MRIRPQRPISCVFSCPCNDKFSTQNENFGNTAWGHVSHCFVLSTPFNLPQPLSFLFIISFQLHQISLCLCFFSFRPLSSLLSCKFTMLSLVISGCALRSRLWAHFRGLPRGLIELRPFQACNPEVSSLPQTSLPPSLIENGFSFTLAIHDSRSWTTVLYEYLKYYKTFFWKSENIAIVKK